MYKLFIRRITPISFIFLYITVRIWQLAESAESLALVIVPIHDVLGCKLAHSAREQWIRSQRDNKYTAATLNRITFLIKRRRSNKSNQTLPTVDTLITIMNRQYLSRDHQRLKTYQAIKASYWTVDFTWSGRYHVFVISGTKDYSIYRSLTFDSICLRLLLKC